MVTYSILLYKKREVIEFTVGSWDTADCSTLMFSDQFKSKDSSPFIGPRVTGVDTSSISIKMTDIISLGT